jgi:hypothetical protein
MVLSSISRTFRGLQILLAIFCCAGLCATVALGQAPPASAVAGSVVRPIGTIKAISGNTITLAADGGTLFSVAVADDTRLLRIEPGEKDLKQAMPLQMQDLQVGDRILVLGQLGADGHSLAASSLVAMKKADVESKQQRDQQEWQRHGVGGLVQSVDPAVGTITISMASLAGTKNVTVQTTKATIVRRYAPDSVKFDDAKVSTIDQIKPGDQLRARGMRSEDGSSLSADEIVSGSFRNIAGTISSIDLAASTMAVMDLSSKKSVTVKITPQSQVRKLSPQIAQFVAMRLKGGAAGNGAANAPANSAGNGADAGASGGAVPGNGSGGGAGRAGGAGGGRGGDLQQVLVRMPQSPLSDFQKGDAVMIVSTQGSDASGVTAITVVGGVEPILQASPAGDQSMILPPFSLDSPGGDAQ